MENQERKAYLTIGSVRSLDIRVIFEDTEILYEGAVEDAPEEIKRLRYSKVKIQIRWIFMFITLIKN